MTKQKKYSRVPLPGIRPPGADFTVRQLANHWQVSEKTVKRRIKEGKIEAYSLENGALRITPEAVDTHKIGRRVIIVAGPLKGE